MTADSGSPLSDAELLIDDVVQETFLAVWRGSARYRELEGADVAGWLWRIGSRRLIDALCGAAARQRLWRVLLRSRGPFSPSLTAQMLSGLSDAGSISSALMDG